MRTDVLGVGFDNLTMPEAVERAIALMETRGNRAVTANPETILHCRKDENCARAVNSAQLVVPDGIGDLYASRLLGTPLQERISGADLYRPLVEHLARKGGSVFLYGARPGVARRAGERLLAEFPGLVLAGTEHGFVEDDTALVARLEETRPDLLMVCLGVPRQEQWMYTHRDMDAVGLMIGLGGCLDLIAGDVKRAPQIWQRCGLEWLYRLLSEPKRLPRMMKLPYFLYLAWRIGRRSE